MVINSIPDIGSVLRNAVVFNFKNRPEAMMTADSLLARVQQLFNLLDERKTDYVLVGGIALLTYVEGRNTQDIDLIMALPLLKLFALPSLYRQGSFERVGIYENDLASLMYTFTPRMEPLLEELSGFLNDTDMAEARQTVKDIEARIQKFRKASE